jgi:hypothetical protein
MAMSYSERMRYIQEESNKFVARNKVRDSSELTLIKQAKASSVVQPQIVPNVYSRHTNQIVPPYQEAPERSSIGVFTGVGTQYDYSGILQKAQSCAICADDDSVLNRYIVLPTPCFNRFDFPFVQKNLSTAVTCAPGFNAYPRREAICYSNTNLYVYPSAN